ncbi:MAG: type II secretion system F family protein [Candidatus Omnitrophota bacterium]|nr:type II secretion system F family protein [Candidatus Omnitrophota bacterium]
MPKFIYTAKSKPDHLIKGEIEAETEQEAVERLSKQGQYPVSIKLLDLASQRKSFLGLKKISTSEITLFTRQLCELNESGVNVVKSLSIIANQIPNAYLKDIIKDALSKIKEGASLSESLSAHPDVFSSMYTAMVHSGEIGGTLEPTLKKLADFLENEEELKGSVKSALIYPAFVFTVGILTIVVLLTFVIPRLVSMFKDMGEALPLPTQILISLSGFLRGYWLIILMTLITLLLVFRRTIKTSKGKLSWDSFKLKIALWGQVILKSELGRWLRTLSLLLAGGISILSSLDVSKTVVENELLKLEIEKLIKQLSSGASLSSAMKNSKIFPDFVINIVGVGEDTGSMDKALLRIADNYEKSVAQELKTLTRLLEPMIILFMGLVVGFIVLSMLLPIFQINFMAK